MFSIPFSLHLLSLVTALSASCLQLGCDVSGKFTQDNFSFTLLDGNRSVAWKSEMFSTERLNPENLNFGCVSDDKIIVCLKSENSVSRHAYYNASTGAELIVACSTIMNAGMPLIIEKYGTGPVLAVNSTHVGLTDPYNAGCEIMSHGHQLRLNALSPVHVPEADGYIIAGNNSDVLMLWTYYHEFGMIKLLDFKLPNNGSKSKCPWMPVTEMAVSGNRVYVYGIAADGNGYANTALIAFDILIEKPYVTVAWIFSDDSKIGQSYLSNAVNCTLIPAVDPEYAWFPPTDLNIQLLATPDGYITVSSTTGLEIFRDRGTSGEQTYTNIWGDHYLTYVGSEVAGGSGVLMTGWQIYPPFRTFLTKVKYIPPYGDDFLSSIGFLNFYNASDLNTTSRMMTFNHPSLNTKIVVTAMKYTTSTNETKNVLVATNPPVKDDDHAKPLWTYELPDVIQNCEVKGQIIGVKDKLVIYISNGLLGFIMAIK